MPHFPTPGSLQCPAQTLWQRPAPSSPISAAFSFGFHIASAFPFSSKAKIFSTLLLGSSRLSYLVAVPSLCLLPQPGPLRGAAFPADPAPPHLVDGQPAELGRAVPGPQGHARPAAAKGPFLPSPRSPLRPTGGSVPSPELTCRINAAPQPRRSSSPAGGSPGSSVLHSPRHAQAAPQTRQLGERPARPTAARPSGPPSFAGGGSPTPGRRGDLSSPGYSETAATVPAPPALR